MLKQIATFVVSNFHQPILIMPKKTDHSQESPTAWKVSKYRVFSGPSLPVFVLNTDIYVVNCYSVGIQENTDQKNSVFGHFSYSLVCNF